MNIHAFIFRFYAVQTSIRLEEYIMPYFQWQTYIELADLPGIARGVAKDFI